MVVFSRSWGIERIRFISSRLSNRRLYLYLEKRCFWVENVHMQAFMSDKVLCIARHDFLQAQAARRVSALSGNVSHGCDLRSLCTIKLPHTYPVERMCLDGVPTRYRLVCISQPPQVLLLHRADITSCPRRAAPSFPACQPSYAY